jgi:carbonic anhydrase
MTDDISAPTGPPAPTPAQAWRDLTAGNVRFVDGTPLNADQDVARRAAIVDTQRPYALMFGCSDSRVAAEIVFDQGLGHLFVVRTAGHVVDSGVLGSIEFGVDALAIPLVVVLGHDRCGAVAATVAAVRTGVEPTGHVREIVDRVRPSVRAAREAGGPSAGDPSTDAVETEHVRQTVRRLVEESPVLADRVTRGRCVVVGLVYALLDGKVRLVEQVGALDG